MTVEKKVNVSIGLTPTLIKQIDAEAVQLGLSRSAFLAMTAVMYIRQQQATSMLNQASDLVEKVKQMQEENQLNLWSEEVAKAQV